MAAVNSSKMRNWQVRDAVAEDISDILQMIKVQQIQQKSRENAPIRGALISYYNLYNLAEHKLLMSSNVVLCLVVWGILLTI